VSGLWVVLLTTTLAALALVIARPRRTARGRRPGADGAPDWLREPPLPAAAAERRALDLLRSVVNDDEWEMFRDLGFICVPGRRRGGGVARYRYLIYPHLPVIALLPRSMAPVREYCVQFPDHSAPGATRLLPVGDDVLAKWMTLRADEDRLLAYANVGGAGCQVPLGRIERDLRRLRRWRDARPQKGAGGASGGAPGAGPAAGRSSAVSSSMRR
jgi:hypothetical protein